jgi:hypothetical protein
MDAIEADIEIFSWIGLASGALLAIVALVAYVADGTWVPARAFVEATERGRVVRWFDEDGSANEAPLSHEQLAVVGGADQYDIFSRRGWRNRMRLTRHSPLVRLLTLLAAGLVALGLVALIVSYVLLFTRG